MLPHTAVVVFPFAGIAAVELTKWYKKEGDTIEEVRDV